MRTLFAAAVLALSTATSFAQTSSWALTSVEGADKNTVGYIYHVYAIGTATVGGVNSPVTAGLRFICSTKSLTPTAPIMAIYWNAPLQSGPTQEIVLEVSNKVARLSDTYIHDGSILYIPANVPANLVALKQGKTAKFTWTANENAKYAVSFNLKDFDLGSFNSLCKSKL